MTVTIGRRQLLAAIGGAAAAWPLAASAQQPAMPVIGFLGSGSPQPFAEAVAAVWRGLNETAKTYQWSITGRRVNSIACRSWLLI